MGERANSYVIPFVTHVDALYPSLYTATTDPAKWVAIARRTISEAKRIGRGMPVRPFIWPQYHDVMRRPLAGTYINAEYWILQLTTIRDARVSGIIFWGGYKTRWDDSQDCGVQRKTLLPRSKTDPMIDMQFGLAVLIVISSGAERASSAGLGLYLSVRQSGSNAHAAASLVVPIAAYLYEDVRRACAATHRSPQTNAQKTLDTIPIHAYSSARKYFEPHNSAPLEHISAELNLGFSILRE
jgi:hypothetical protein